MKEFNEAKKDYESTPIPQELQACVQEGIRQGKEHHRKAHQKHRWGRSLGAFAACFVVVLAGLNLSPGFAAAAAEVPVLGGLFQVLTVRSFVDADEDRTITVKQPGVTGDGDFAKQIDAEIQKRVDEKLAAGEQIAEDAKAAFLATGGTEEAWAQRDTTVSVDYTVKSQTNTTVSFVVDTFVSVASAYQEQFFYNLDLAAGKEITLADVLGEDWVKICNAEIRGQMAAAEDPTVFFDESMGGFTGVDADTQFYLNEAGNAVVVFPRATVAIGAMGAVEFEIVK